MTHQIIIGGGPVATNAIETIRQLDSGASEITLVSDEPAHSRMALPYWLAGQIPREQTFTGDDGYFEKLGVNTRFGQRAVGVDSQASTITLDDGRELAFDNLLIATGASPLVPDIPGRDLPGVQPMWSLAHTESALATTDSLEAPRAVLIGGGFVGFIVLNAMFKRGWKLSVVEREAHVLPRMLDVAAGRFVEDWLNSRNVAVHTATTAQAIRQADDGSKIVELADGVEIAADLVILATGIRSNVDFLDGSGIETDEGILVDDSMRTNFPNIYAGGDVAQGPVLFGGGRAIHAIQPTAVDHGRVAGTNMAGHEVHYPGSLLMNVVDVCGLQSASFGNWDDPAAEEMTISNPTGHIYRKLLWTGDRITGAIFIGRANDLGMLPDVGMIKGILQTQAPLGPWKEFLRENPFDIRRAYIGAGVAQRLVNATLLGRATQPRSFHFGNASPEAKVGPAHAVYVGEEKS